MSILCVPGVDRPELAWQRVRAPANSDKIATTTHPGKIVVVQAARSQLSGEGYVRNARFRLWITGTGAETRVASSIVILD